MKRLDALLIQNSQGLLSNSQRWDLQSEIEYSINSQEPCIACSKHYPGMPSKSVDESNYCKGHLRYSFKMAFNPYNFLE